MVCTPSPIQPLLLNGQNKIWALLLGLCLPTGIFGQVEREARWIIPPDARYNSFVSRSADGFTWISSLDGLYRFDGIDFVHFPVLDEEGQPTEDQNIQSPVLGDGHGTLWVSTYTGLHRLNPYSGKWENHTLIAGSGDTLSTMYHLLFAEKGAGRLWLIADGRIGTFSPKDRGFSPLPFRVRGRYFAMDTFASGAPRAMVGCPWNAGTGIEYLERDTPDAEWSYRPVFFGEGDTTIEVTRAAFVNRNLVYVATNRGLGRFVPGTGELSLLADDDLFPGDNCFDVKVDPKGRFLFVSYPNQGLTAYRIDEAGKIRPASAGQLPDGKGGRELWISPSGAVWISQAGRGLLMVPAARYGKRSPPSVAMEPDLIKVHQAPDGEIFGISPANIVYRYEKGGRWASFTRIPEATDSPRQLFSDSENLFALYPGRLWKLPRNNPLALSSGTIDGPPWRRVSRSPTEDLIVVTSGDVRMVTGVENGQVTTRTDSLFGAYQKAEIYLAECEGEDLFLAGNMKMTHFHNWSDGPRISRQIPLAAEIKCVARDSLGASNGFWVGSREGLYWYPGGEAKRVRLGPVDRDLEIFDILPVDQGVWLGTNRGLGWLGRDAGDFRLFGVAAGLPGADCQPDGLFLTKDEHLVVLTDKGVATLDGAALLRQPSVRLSPYPSAFSINEVPYAGEVATAYLDRLRLSYLQNNLEFRLSNVGEAATDQRYVDYRLLPRDSAWSRVEEGRYARFSGLSPGPYTLELLARHEDESPGESRRISIDILPPLWQRSWFQALVLGFVSLLLYGIHRFIVARRLREAREELRREREVAAERERIAAELHDDLGGDLSSILFTTQSFAYLSEVEKKTELARIEKLASGAITNMRDMIWALDGDAIELRDLADKLMDLARDFARTAGWELQLQLPDTLPEVTVSSEQKRNVYLIVKESLQNVLKHARARNVSIAIEQEQPKILQITVSDNGRGYPSALLSGESTGSGRGMQNLNDRANRIGGRVECTNLRPSGARLRLAFPLAEHK